MSFDPYRARFPKLNKATMRAFDEPLYAPPAVASPAVVDASEFMPPEVAEAIRQLAETVMTATGRRLMRVQIDASVPARVQMVTSGGVVDVQFTTKDLP